MKTLLAIPSKGRPYDLQKTILKWINEIDIDYRVFVEPSEYVHYKLNIGKTQLVNIEKNDQGIGYAMNFIGNYAIQNGYDLVCRVDDDCSGFISKYFSNGKTGFSAQIFNSSVKDIVPDFGDEKLGAVRFLDPKNHLFESIGKARKYTHRNCELFHGWIIRPKFLLYLNENVKHNDDTALYLYVLRDGYYTLLYGRIGVQFKDGSNKGGFQMLDRTGLTQSTYEYLKKDFPKLALKPIDRWYKIDLDISQYSCRKPL